MKEKDLQGSLFGDEEVVTWKQNWKNMPEFIQEDMTPVQQVIVSFETREDVRKFGKLLGQKLTYKTKSIWWPKVENTTVEHLRWDDDKK